MRARIELKEGLDYQRGGRKFVRGEAVITEDPAEIAFYRSHSSFGVTMLKDRKDKPIAAPVKVAKPRDEEEDLEEDHDGDEEEGDEPEDLSTPPSDEEDPVTDDEIANQIRKDADVDKPPMKKKKKKSTRA